jgi:aspartate ammonia-lyase
VHVPKEAQYGAHTVRALRNFPHSPPLLRDLPGFVVALARTKRAAATANGELDELPLRIVNAIVQAAAEVEQGDWQSEFPLPVVQGGGGTSTNMNMNEVLANRAGELLGDPRGSYRVVHPIDHVNRSQSSNDVYPTALSVAVLKGGGRVLDAFGRLADACEAKGMEAAPELMRLGRTCLQDALPISVRDTHSSHAHGLRLAIDSLRQALDALRTVPLGGTAVGTGFGAPTGYSSLAIEALSRLTEVDLVESENPMSSLQSLDPFVAVAQALTRLMTTTAKIAQDLRFLSSGPVGGIGEVVLPAVQAGSSAMPGKVNPVIPELIIQVSFQTRGSQAAVEAAGAAGELELNVMEPTVAAHLLPTLDTCASAAIVFTQRCIEQLSWRLPTLTRHLDGSLAAAVEVAHKHGYETSAKKVAKHRSIPTAED